MSESLIAQLKRLAEAQKVCAAIRPSPKYEFEVNGVNAGLAGQFVLDAVSFDFPALLAHMQAQQAVVDAARELRKLGPLAGGSLRASIAAVEAAVIALDAALEKESNGKG